MRGTVLLRSCLKIKRENRAYNHKHRKSKICHCIPNTDLEPAYFVLDCNFLLCNSKDVSFITLPAFPVT